MKNFKVALLFLLALSSTQLYAIQRVAYSRKTATITASKWEVVDIVFKAEAKGLRNPFATDLSARFTREGSSMSVPAFYDGEGCYVVRFVAPETGGWSFVTESELPKLSGLKGSVQVSPNPGHKGAIVLDKANPRRLFYADGSTYFQNAAEVDWLFALDYDNPAATPKLDTLLGIYKENGINQLIFNAFAYDSPWVKDPALKPGYDYGGRAIFPFLGTNAEPDYSSLNLAFFRHLDRVMAATDREGIVAHMMIYVWNKRVNWPEAGSEGDKLFYDYIVKRYQGFPNLIWDISKEALAHGKGGQAGIDFITSKIARLKELDAYGRLVTVHDFAYCSRNPDKVDIISVQNWNTDLYSRMKAIVARFPDRVVFNIENGSYEDGPYEVVNCDYSDPVVVLERAYAAVFAGVYPSYYWQGTAWNVIVHNPYALPKEQQPAFRYYKHMTGFFARHDYNQLATFERELSSGLCLATEAKDKFVFLIPKENNLITVKFNELLKGSQVDIVWFNPFTGEYKPAKRIDFRRNTKLEPPWKRQMSIAVMTEVKAPARVEVPKGVFPKERWEHRTPQQMGVDNAKLDTIVSLLGSSGCIVKDGYIIREWGRIDTINDWFSSAKPVLSTILFHAIQEGKVAGVDQPIVEAGWEGFSEKDKGITYRHLGAMTSGYARPEAAGKAYSYNDYAIQLYQMTLFDKVYGGDTKGVTEKVFGPLGMEDGLVWTGKHRFKSSVRDFARIVWLWSNYGYWDGGQHIRRALFDEYMTPQVPVDMPHTDIAVPTNDDLGIKSYGGESFRKDAYDGPGSYGFNWWFNGPNPRKPTERILPSVPDNMVMSLGAWGNHSLFFKDNGIMLVSARGDWKQRERIVKLLLEAGGR